MELTSCRAEDGCREQLATDATHDWRAREGGWLTGVVSRVEIQLTMEATGGPRTDVHQQGQNLAHHGERTSAPHSRTGEPKTGVVSRDQMQLNSEVTHKT